jgi:hypothetical protein
MTVYRVYAVGREGQVLGFPQVIECADDAEALREAHRLLNDHDLEVWEDVRFVHRLRHGRLC